MGRMRAAFLAAIIGMPIATASGALAETDATITLLAAGCANCHGPDGHSPGAMPTIAGASVDVLKAKLLAFRKDEAPGTTVMVRLAKGFSEEELIALAEHFASLKP